MRNVGYKDIFKIPLPEECSKWYVSGTNLYKVKDIKNTAFQGLEGKIVKGLPSGTVAKQRIINPVNRQFKKDENGNYLYNDYTVSSGSMVVVSDEDLEIPFSYWKSPKEGYGYVDFVLSRERGMEFMYMLPKESLYKVNQTALVLSVKDMKNYMGMGYNTWNSGKIFLHVIPYNPRSQYVGSKILKTGYSLNYNEEIKTIVNFWQSCGLIPEIRLCYLEDESNLCLKPTTVGYDEYEPVEMLPICDREVYGSDGGVS